MMKRIVILLAVIAGLFYSCTIKLNGASIPAEMKTINIQFFENNAPLVIPYLSQQFTEDLKTRVRNQSRLSLSQTDADATMEGRITGYDIKPVSLADNQQQLNTGASRLTITISVKYTNNLNAKQSFEESFSRYKDFTLTGSNLEAQQPQLIKDINAQLTEDVFNRAFAQW